MLLTPQHRRSARITKKTQVVPKKETKIEYDLATQCDEEFASDWNEKTQQRDIVEDDEEELPFFDMSMTKSTIVLPVVTRHLLTKK